MGSLVLQLLEVVLTILKSSLEICNIRYYLLPIQCSDLGGIGADGGWLHLLMQFKVHL